PSARPLHLDVVRRRRPGGRYRVVLRRDELVDVGGAVRPRLRLGQQVARLVQQRHQGAEAGGPHVGGEVNSGEAVARVCGDLEVVHVLRRDHARDRVGRERHRGGGRQRVVGLHFRLGQRQVEDVISVALAGGGGRRGGDPREVYSAGDDRERDGAAAVAG